MMRLVVSEENQNYETKEKFTVSVGKVNADSHISQEYIFCKGEKKYVNNEVNSLLSQAIECIRKYNFLKENILFKK